MSDLPAVLGASVFVAAAVWLIFLLKTPAVIKQVLVVSRAAAAHLGDKSLSDDEKETMAQQQSLALFGLFFRILFCFGVAVLVPAAVFWVFDYLGLLSLRAVIGVTFSINFLLACTVVGVLVSFVVARLRRRTADEKA